LYRLFCKIVKYRLSRNHKKERMLDGTARSGFFSPSGDRPIMKGRVEDRMGASVATNTNVGAEFEYLTSERGFAALVGIALRLGTLVTIHRRQRTAVGSRGNRAREKPAGIGKETAAVSENLDPRKRFGRIGGLDVAFGNAPETGREPPPVRDDFVWLCSGERQN
jgi:hypothetical protein